jgi:hypothetical protein
MPLPILGILGALTPLVSSALNRLLPEDPEKRQEIEFAIQKEIMANTTSLELAAADIIKAEAESESWLTSNWRPLLMLVAITIIANNYILAPYLGAMFGWNVILEIPPQLWQLLTLGVGGYIGGRSAEKVMGIWKNGAHPMKKAPPS